MFKKAIPIFPREISKKMNSLAVFKLTAGTLRGTELHVAAADFYQLKINGKLVAHGPARTAKGYARMDVISLDSFDSEKNEISISVASYNCLSISTVFQPSFLCAEIVRDDEILAYTGHDFDCYVSNERIREAERYSPQRHFCEIWDFTAPEWGKKTVAEPIESAPVIISRIAPYPVYNEIKLTEATRVGALKFDASITPRYEFVSFVLSKRWGIFDYDEIKQHSFEWVQQHTQIAQKSNVKLPESIKAGEYATFDFGRIEVGFITLEGVAKADTELVIAFSEYSRNGVFEFTDIDTHNVIDLKLKCSEKYNFNSFEPYAARHVYVAVKKGLFDIHSIGITTFEADISAVFIPNTSDKILNGIFLSSARTYAHNAVDIYTDCPSRERGGYLCDSYFTAKAEYAMFGKAPTEEAFLQNYRLYKNEGEFPEGVLPMCFPSSALDSNLFIPQWTMWYVIEVEEYVNIRGHESEKELFRESIFKLLDFYARYENSDGLLERLPSWKFIEWSRANQWTKDVNYPTNFLYSKALECVYLLYGDTKYLKKAEHVRQTSVEQSFNGRLFLDHSVRDSEGKLQLLNDCSEICQYYALLFANIDINDEKYDYLRNLVLTVFGAGRTVLTEEIEPINAFIGVYLRIEALLKMGEDDLVISDVKSFFGGMSDKTGTLWENRQITGSLDHGFAAYAIAAYKSIMQKRGELPQD